MQFTTSGDRHTYGQKSPVDRSLHHGNGHDSTVYTERYPLDGVTHSLQTVEMCARLCILAPSCDMFEWDGSSSCKLFPFENRKLLNLFEIIEPDPGFTKAIYVLHCAQAMENIVSNSDFSHNTFERKYSANKVKHFCL